MPAKKFSETEFVCIDTKINLLYILALRACIIRQTVVNQTSLLPDFEVTKIDRPQNVVYLMV